MHFESFFRPNFSIHMIKQHIGGESFIRQKETEVDLFGKVHGEWVRKRHKLDPSWLDMKPILPRKMDASHMHFCAQLKRFSELLICKTPLLCKEQDVITWEFAFSCVDYGRIKCSSSCYRRIFRYSRQMLQEDIILLQLLLEHIILQIAKLEFEDHEKLVFSTLLLFERVKTNIFGNGPSKVIIWDMSQLVRFKATPSQ